MRYYIVHKDTPHDALRVCKNLRYAEMIIQSINNPEYIISTGPIDRIINRVVSDLGEPVEQVFGRLS